MQYLVSDLFLFHQFERTLFFVWCFSVTTCRWKKKPIIEHSEITIHVLTLLSIIDQYIYDIDLLVLILIQKLPMDALVHLLCSCHKYYFNTQYTLYSLLLVGSYCFQYKHLNVPYILCHIYSSPLIIHKYYIQICKIKTNTIAPFPYMK